MTKKKPKRNIKASRSHLKCARRYELAAVRVHLLIWWCFQRARKHEFQRIHFYQFHFQRYCELRCRWAAKICLWNGFFQSQSTLWIGEVICYYGSWAKNRPSIGKFTVEDIEPKYCSIIIYCCVGLNEDATIKPYDAESMVAREVRWRRNYFQTCDCIFAGDLPKLISLKNSNSNVKLLTAIGGPNEHTEIYSTMVRSPEMQSKFVGEIVEFLKRHKLDGLDYMWENPDQSSGMPVEKVLSRLPCIFGLKL